MRPQVDFDEVYLREATFAADGSEGYKTIEDPA